MKDEEKKHTIYQMEMKSLYNFHWELRYTNQIGLWVDQLLAHTCYLLRIACMVIQLISSWGRKKWTRMQNANYVIQSSKMSLNLEKIKNKSFVCLKFRALSRWNTSSKFSTRFQRYSHFRDAQNMKIQRKSNTLLALSEIQY